MKLKLNDKVLVIAGKDKGKSGRIIRVIKKQEKLVVEKVNMRTKHIKKTSERPGEKITFEGPIHASNVMILDPKENKPTRIGYKVISKGKKERISVLTGLSLDEKSAPSAVSEKKADEAKPKKKTTPKKSEKKVIKA
jgi:large subunit ribosomal protein L24